MWSFFHEIFNACLIYPHSFASSYHTSYRSNGVSFVRLILSRIHKHCQNLYGFAVAEPIWALFSNLLMINCFELFLIKYTKSKKRIYLLVVYPSKNAKKAIFSDFLRFRVKRCAKVCDHANLT